MPLSEHEQRLLDQIERALYADDPKFASAVRTHDLKSHLVRRVKRFAALLVLGLAGLLAGTILPNLVLGVAGFLVMLVAGLVVFRSVQRLRGAAEPSLPRIGKGGRKPGRKADRPSLRERIEDRWQRRFPDSD